MSAYDHVHRPVTVTVTVGDAMQLMGALTVQLRSRRERYGADDLAVLDARRLLWKLEEAAAGGGGVSHSQEALAPEGTPPPPEEDREADEAPAPEHNFSLERQLLDGTWKRRWSSATPGTLRWRAVCNCGWHGHDITGDHVTGREDHASRELAYDHWDREHAPGYEVRHTPT